ncbi:hypothetical protein F2Q70_00004657 [Brassica cretica]|uniref:Uncharacterized protein n=1 Tax=Brassica cretica TaxID=69181 RepID=A0A8S9IYK9_BRACR|nr:hypothetical protein F2Q70_00004657 [Brassica cretica]
MISIQLLDDIMAKRDEQHGFGEPTRAAEAETSDPTSTSIDTTPATSIDINTSMLIDNSTSKSIDIGTSETIDTSTATLIDSMTSTSIDRTTSESITQIIPSSIDRDSCFRTRPLEIPESSSCPQDIADLAQKSIDISSCDPTSYGDREITMEDFLELEEFLELEDGEKLEDLDSIREHTSRGDLETSPKASIDRHQPDGIDRQPPHIIDQRPPYIIDFHPHSIIDRHQPNCIDRHPLLDEPHGYIVELEQVEERVHESEASHNVDSKHLRPPIWTEEAVGFHKRVKRIHDPVKIVVPCDVFEAESPIPPDRSMQFSYCIAVLDDHQHAEASHRGLRFRDEVDKGPAEAASIDTDQISSNDTNKLASIDISTSPSIDTGRVSEQKESDECGNLRDGDTTTRSNKFGGKKRRNWKKRKMIMGDSQLSLIPRFSDGVRKFREIQSTQQMLFTVICKASSTLYC